MATAYLFNHIITQAESDSLNASTPVDIELDFPATQTGTNWAVSIELEDTADSAPRPFVLNIHGVTSSSLTVTLATLEAGATVGNLLRFHILVQQVQ
jgi:hypothetical protein